MNIKKLFSQSHMWIIALLILGVILVQGIDGASTLLPFALLLLCPIMMMFMMGGKGHKH